MLQHKALQKCCPSVFMDYQISLYLELTIEAYSQETYNPIRKCFEYKQHVLVPMSIQSRRLSKPETVCSGVYGKTRQTLVCSMDREGRWPEVAIEPPQGPNDEEAAWQNMPLPSPMSWFCACRRCVPTHPTHIHIHHTTHFFLFPKFSLKLLSDFWPYVHPSATFPGLHW